MTRIALSITVVITLVVAGIILVQLDPDPADPTEVLAGGAATGSTSRAESGVATTERLRPAERRTTTTTAATTTTKPKVTTTSQRPPTTTRGANNTPTTEPPAASTTTLPDGKKFDIILTNAETSVHWWTAPYVRWLPYTEGVGWTDGDKSGYRCAYMHLYRNGDPNDIVGRVTFSRPVDQAYGKVNDSKMLEGQTSERAYDGGLDWTSQAECPDPDEDYKPLPLNTADQRPIIRYVDSAGNLLEDRSYTNTTGEAIEAGTLIFREAGHITKAFTDTGGISTCDDYCTVYERFKVIAYELHDGEWLPAMTMYYDILVPDVTFG